MRKLVSLKAKSSQGTTRLQNTRTYRLLSHQKQIVLWDI